MARPKSVFVDKNKLETILKLRPSTSDCAALLDVNRRSLERFIRDEYDMTFLELRDTQVAFTKRKLINRALEMADSGNPTMLIFCLKNICGWSDSLPQDDSNAKPIQLLYAVSDKKESKFVNEKELKDIKEPIEIKPLKEKKKK